MVDFNNTEIAFKQKSTAELSTSYWLFKIIGWNWLIKIGPTLLKIFLPLKFPIPIIKATIFKQFCGGESIEDCTKTINNLGVKNVKTILDYSVEGIEGEDTFNANVEEALKGIQMAQQNSLIPFCVFKVSGFGRFSLLQKINDKKSLTDTEKLEFTRVKTRINTICEKSHQANTPVFIDAEETWIQNVIDDLALEMMMKFNKESAIVYNTAQMYRWDKLDYLKSLVEIAKKEHFFIGIKLVRGAYIEKERNRALKFGYKDPMQITKENTDNDFNTALKYCIENIDIISLCCGSHNEKSTLYLTELMSTHKISKNDKRIYFAQLLGMSDHISMNLSDANYNVAKYVPYGPVKEVMPYLIRRAEENTSVAGQTGRELSLILKEKERRKTLKV